MKLRDKGGNFSTVKLSCPTILLEEQEAHLVSLILDYESRLFGLMVLKTHRSSSGVWLCEKNWIANNFNHLLQTAGEDWARSFIGMHLTLSVHKTEPVCIFRASGFNKEKVNWFYDVLEPILFKETFTVPAQNIFNILCTCISVMVICSTNGCGMFIPPMLIFPSG